MNSSSPIRIADREIARSNPVFSAAGSASTVKGSILSKRELMVVIFTLAMLLFAGYDAVREIPPIADDLWMREYSPGQILVTYVGEHGWLGRVLGQVVIDLVNSLTTLTGCGLVVSLLAVRALSLALVYGCLRKFFAQPMAVSLSATALFALTPAAQEGWAMLCVTNLMLTAPAALAACGLFWRA